MRITEKLWHVGIVMVLMVILSCTANSSKVHDDSNGHPHKYPLTKTVGDYHVRLIVNHEQGKMWLVFEDYKERTARVVRPKHVPGRVHLPDGQILDITFHPVPPPWFKYHRPRPHHEQKLVYAFVNEGDWIKEAPKFLLRVNLLFGGQRYELEYDYVKPEKIIEQ